MVLSVRAGSRRQREAKEGCDQRFLGHPFIAMVSSVVHSLEALQNAELSPQPEHELQPMLPPGFLTSHQEGGNFSSSLHTAGCSLLLLTLLLLSLCLEQTPLFA